MPVLAIAIAGFLSWLVSTLGAGGGEFILLGAAAFLLGAGTAAPIVTLSSLVAGPARAWMFRRAIDWAIVRWFAAGAVPGGVLGAWLFTRTQAAWLQVLIAVFLLTAPLQYAFGARERTFAMRLGWFLPAGFVVALLSGLVGSLGPVLNPLYLNYRSGKDATIATKSFNSLVMHVAKIGTYASLGAIGSQALRLGLAAGLAGAAGAWVARRWLRSFSERRFRQVVLGLMSLSGAIVLWQQRAALVAFWDTIRP